MRKLNKPEYIYRPRQLITRLLSGLKDSGAREVTLPWKSKIRVSGDEMIGRSICTYGIYDLVVTEAILRLLDPGETALDVGANIGYTACVMASRLGSRGRVFCFEASRAVFQDLMFNVQAWSKEQRLAPIEPYQLAVSSQTGTAQLNLPDQFAQNRGVASLEPECTDKSYVSETVPTIDLNSWAPPKLEFGLLKIDVEGHEPAVLEGASHLLASGRVRDIIFEEHGRYPTTAQIKLQSHGYEIYRLSRTLRRLLLLPVDDPREWFEHPIGVMPNYLATRNVQRTRERFAEPGWFSLKSP